MQRQEKDELETGGDAMMNNSNLIKSEKGMALIFVTITLALSMLVIGPLLGFIGGSGRAAQIREDRMHGYFAADAGWELACNYLQNEVPEPGNGTIYIDDEDVNGNDIDVVVDTVADSTYRITSTATDFEGKTTVVVSHVYATFEYFQAPQFDHAIVADDTINLKQNNSTIGMDQGSLITGDATAVGQIEGGNVTGSRTEGAPPIAWPTEFNTQGFQDEAMLNYHSGDYTVGKGPDTLYLGPLYVEGNLIIGKDNTVVIEGPVYVAGSIQIGKNSSLTGTGAVIAELDIDLDQMLMSGPDDHLFIMSVTGNIEFDQTVNSRGLVFAPNGDITFNQSATFRGAVIGSNVTVSQSSNIFYEHITDIWDELPEDYSPTEVAVLDYIIEK